MPKYLPALLWGGRAGFAPPHLSKFMNKIYINVVRTAGPSIYTIWVPYNLN